MSIRIMSLKLSRVLLYGLGALVALILLIVLIVSLAGGSGGSGSAQYHPGRYVATVPFGSHSVTVNITFSEDAITAVSCDVPEDVASVYPLLAPTVSSIGEQLLNGTEVSAVSVDSTAMETGTYLLDSISLIIENARVADLDN